MKNDQYMCGNNEQFNTIPTSHAKQTTKSEKEQISQKMKCIKNLKHWQLKSKVIWIFT